MSKLKFARHLNSREPWRIGILILISEAHLAGQCVPVRILLG
jgi:hypothetical protein